MKYDTHSLKMYILTVSFDPGNFLNNNTLIFSVNEILPKGKKSHQKLL